MAQGLLWLGWILGNPQGSQKRLVIFRTYGWLVAATGILVLICRIQRWPFPFTTPGAYGIFPNTNHMSNWLAVAAVLLAGTAYADFRRRSLIPAAFSILGIAAILTCLAANSSRGGLGICFAGLIVWSIAQSLAGPEKKIGILLLAGAALAATALLVQGAKPLERMKKPWMGSAAGTLPTNPSQNQKEETLDFRLLLQRDALDLAAHHPGLGVGPGNFRYFFPSYRQRTTSNQSTAIHPESDWLWMLCELGWPFTVVLIGGTIFFLCRAGPGKNREGWITRSAGLAAVLAFALHSLVDVPGHRIGTVWPILMVAGLVLGRKREAEEHPAPMGEIWGFRAMALILAALAVAWTWGVASGSGWPASVAAERAKSSVGVAWKSGQPELALQAAEKGLREVPLDQVLRFLHGKALLFFEDSEKETVAEFSVQSRLEPFLVSVPLDQAAAWIEIIPSRPELAIPAYEEALRRASKFQVRDKGPERVLDHMVRMAGRSPGLRPRILPLIESQPQLLALYFASLPGDQFQPAVTDWLLKNPELAGWSRDSLATLAVSWARRGNPDALRRILETKPEWEAATWPVLAQLRVRSGEIRQALSLVHRHLPAPALPDEPCPPAQAESRWYRSPRDYGAAFVLSENRRKAGDLTGARVVLEKITERPETPAYFWWLRSRLEMEEGRDPAAWESLKKYLQRSVPGWPSL